MPLVDSRGFNLNQPVSISPITQALQGVFQRKRQQDEVLRLEGVEKNKQTLKTTAAQFFNVIDIQDTAVNRQAGLQKQKAMLSKLAIAARERGEDIKVYEDGININTPDDMNLYLTRIATRAEQVADNIIERQSGAGKDRANFQQGQTRFAKDEDDNLFQVSAAFDPNNADTQGLVTPINHNNEPVGKLEVMSRSGLTPKARVEQAEAIEEIKTEEVIKRETGKKEVALKLDARIAESVELAKVKAKDEGLAFTELEQMNASLPLLKESIGELKELSEIATFTKGGRAFDALVRESGFGATEGATARAKYIAIVNNQVLPLLRPTFGAAFTVQEGESLKTTMGDPNASPEEKQAQLEAFIEQKERDIRAKQRRLDPTEPEIAEGATATNPTTGEKIIFRGGQWQKQ